MARFLEKILIISLPLWTLHLKVPFSSARAGESDLSKFGWRSISLSVEGASPQTVLLDSANGWVIGGEKLRYLYHLKNGVWQVELGSANIQFFGVLGFFGGGPWFVCLDKSRYRYFLRYQKNGKTIDYYTPNADPIEQMDYLAPDNIWAGCQWGQIIHFNGTSWRLIRAPTFGHIKSISMANDSCGWASAKYRDTWSLLHWNGRRWQIKMQIKGAINRVLMVNDSLGWGFLESDSQIIRLTRNRREMVPLAPLIQDTLIATWPEDGRPIFYNTNAVATANGIATFADRQRDILWNVGAPDKPTPKFYLLSHDGSVKYVHFQQPISPKIRWQYVGTIIEGAGDEYGVAMGDIDGDGDDDIYSINTVDKNRLLLFNGNRQIRTLEKRYLIDGAEHLNLLGLAKSKQGAVIFDMGATIADMDNDGDRDLYVTSMYEKNALFENLKNQTFREVAVKAGVAGGIVRSQVGIWGDVDNDGDVDLFVTNEDTTNMLFLNNGFGSFREITHLAGLTSQRGGKSATFGDLDGDGDLDLVVTFFNLPNRIYRNDGIHPKTKLPFYTDMTDHWLPLQPDSLAKSTAACLADFDNDGDLDLYICNLVSTNRLYENDGTGRLTDITESAGLLDSCLTSSACFFDAENDGDLDLFLSNRGPNLFFKNTGNKKFVLNNKTFKMEPDCYSNGVACGDPDNDGDIDIHVANNDAESIYYQNLLNNKSYLEIKLIGTKSNRDAIGARAFLYEVGHLDQSDHLLGMREVNGGYGYGCMNSTTIHFGVPSGNPVDLKICFPSGIVITRTDLSPGQILVIEEQAGWSKFLALRQRGIMRLVKSQRLQIEFIKFMGLLIVLIAAFLFVDRKKWLAFRTEFYLLTYPLGIYLVLVALARDYNFWLSFLVPMSLAIGSFVGIILLEKHRITRASQERVAEELLVACKAFDHGSWATSCLNQLQLFCNNLPPNQPISEKVAEQLKETIVSFY